MSEVADKALELLTHATYWAYSLSLGTLDGARKDYFTRMSNPEVGDLVMEITNFGAKPIDRIGRLISADQEPPPYLDEATYDEEEWEGPWPPYLEKVWRIKTLDGREFYWTNARFIVIPEDDFKLPNNSNGAKE
jgi:hypothetical protein